MITSYGFHAGHDAAVAGHELRRAIRELAADEAYPDRVGLGTLADLANVLADGLDRYWWSIRPLVEQTQEEESKS
jgi:hypothetical protein